MTKVPSHFLVLETAYGFAYPFKQCYDQRWVLVPLDVSTCFFGLVEMVDFA